MIAYNCTKCGKYFDGRPSGIIYDNRNGKGPRLDICPGCMDDLMKDFDEKKKEKEV